MVFSRPRLSFDPMKRFDRRNMMAYRSDPLPNYATRTFGYPRDVTRRGVVPVGTRLWPGGVIPVDLSKIKSGKDQAMILQAMSELMEDTSAIVGGTFIPCITIRRRIASDKVYVAFQDSEKGCWTNGLGYRPGQQIILNLERPDCWTTGTIEHELMHIIGFDHEMMRPDRDNYVTVYLNRVDPDFLDQYNKYAQGTTVDLMTPYDPQSIMHYDVFYDKDGNPDIESKPGVTQIKPSERLSKIDVKEVRKLYQCKG